MNKPLTLYCNKNRIVKWFLAIVVFVSLFSFGDIAATPGKPQIYHASLQVSSNYAVKKSVTYYSYSYQLNANARFDNLYRVNEWSYLHSELAKIQLIKHSVPYISVKVPSIFHHNTVAGSASDDSAVLV